MESQIEVFVRHGGIGKHAACSNVRLQGITAGQQLHAVMLQH
jgi:hypothetical protein